MSYCVSLETLPASMRELVSLVGITATLAIVKARGGIRLYVPVNADAEGELATLIGLDPLKNLVDIYAGEEIEIPRCIEALTAIKHQMILDDASNGMTITNIARKYEYTERGIRKALRRAEAAREQPADQIEWEF